MLGRIVAPHFVAGVVFDADRVVKAAPIVRYMMGWSSDRVCKYVDKKNWNIERLD